MNIKYQPLKLKNQKLKPTIQKKKVFQERKNYPQEITDIKKQKKK